MQWLRRIGMLGVLVGTLILIGGWDGLVEASAERPETEVRDAWSGAGSPGALSLVESLPPPLEGAGRVQGRINFALPGMPWPEKLVYCSEMTDDYWYRVLNGIKEGEPINPDGSLVGRPEDGDSTSASSSFGREPNDPCRPSQFYLDMIDAPRAWAVQTGDRSVVVAVVDSGIDPNHPDLRDHLVPGFDLVGEGCPWDDSTTVHEDCTGHGTTSAGVIGAVGDNGLGITGVAWHVSLMPVRVVKIFASSLEMVAEGIHVAAEAGADVINVSMTGEEHHRLAEVVADAVARGAVVVAAVGNRAGQPPGYPAAYEGVIGVGALAFAPEPEINPDMTAIGLGVDLVAPGDHILTTILSADYARVSGTSLAAPIVSGVAALMIANGIPHDEVAEVLFRTAIWIGDPINNVADRETYGHGLVNAYAAVMGVDPKETRLRLFTVEGSPAGPAVSPNEQRQYVLDGVPAGEELSLLAWIDVDRDGRLNQGDYVALKRIVLEEGETLTVDVDVAVLDAAISLDVNAPQFDLDALVKALPSEV